MEHPLPSEKTHRDMRPGLIGFGVVSVLLGLGCFLMIPLMLWGTTIQPTGNRAAPTLSMMIPVIMVYLGIGVVDVWLGVGSMLCRRWARALMLLYALFWLISGLMTSGMMLFFMEDMKSAFLSSTAGASRAPSWVLMVPMIIMAIFLVLIPTAFTWFYALRSTRLTCELRDPSVRWTDRHPLPLLALALLHGAMALWLPCMLLYMPLIACFGIWLTGWPAVAAVLMLAPLFGFCAWGLLQRKRSSWILALVTMLMFLSSYMITMLRTGIMEMYRHMNTPAETMSMLEKMPSLQNSSLAWTGLLYIALYLGWMLWSLRYFPKTSPPPK
jgi:hypothetical protein